MPIEKRDLTSDVSSLSQASIVKKGLASLQSRKACALGGTQRGTRPGRDRQSASTDRVWRALSLPDPEIPHRWDSMKQQARISVRGFVQGVSFRAFARHEARTLGLTGYVRNRSNGECNCR